MSACVMAEQSISERRVEVGVPPVLDRLNWSTRLAHRHGPALGVHMGQEDEPSRGVPDWLLEGTHLRRGLIGCQLSLQVCWAAA